MHKPFLALMQGHVDEKRCYGCPTQGACNDGACKDGYAHPFLRPKYLEIEQEEGELDKAQCEVAENNLKVLSLRYM